MIAGPLAARTIERIESHSALAWPAVGSIVVGDWLVRLSDGYTKRANAASAIRAGAVLGDALRAIEAICAAHGQPAQFRLTPLADPSCDMLLAAAGYIACDASTVMIAAAGGSADLRVTIDRQPSTDWLALSSSIAGRDSAHAVAHAALLARIDRPAGYATVVDRGAAVGVGIGVVADGMIGLFDLAVASGHRGRGHGRALVAALRDWGRAQGGATAWLQVADANIGAISLYAAMGFTAAYPYRYRVAAGAPTAG